MFNICVNLPDGMSTFIKVVPTDGSVALTAEFIKEVLLSSAIEASAQQHPLEEFYTSQNGRNVVCACHLQGDALLTREVYIFVCRCMAMRVGNCLTASWALWETANQPTKLPWQTLRASIRSSSISGARPIA